MTSGRTGFNAESLRLLLHEWLKHCWVHETDTVIIDEMGLCQGKTRIDLAVVNGQLHGYEIKSERDNLRRLPTQVCMYGKVFDRVTLVCGKRHVSEALGTVPAWWDILRVTPNGQGADFERVRIGGQNPDRSARALAELLWLEEALNLVAQRRSLRGLRGKPRSAIWDKVCDLFTLEEVAEAVRRHLRATAMSRGRHSRQS